MFEESDGGGIGIRQFQQNQICEENVDEIRQAVENSSVSFKPI